MYQELRETGGALLLAAVVLYVLRQFANTYPAYTTAFVGLAGVMVAVVAIVLSRPSF